jgi:hypothetical protein
MLSVRLPLLRGGVLRLVEDDEGAPPLRGSCCSLEPCTAHHPGGSHASSICVAFSLPGLFPADAGWMPE